MELVFPSAVKAMIPNLLQNGRVSEMLIKHPRLCLSHNRCLTNGSFHDDSCYPVSFLTLKFFKGFIYLCFRERGWEGEHQWARETLISCLSHTPNWGPGPQPRLVPSLGIKPATFWFAGRCSVHWATPARAPISFLFLVCFRCSSSSLSVDPEFLSLNLHFSW